MEFSCVIVSTSFVDSNLVEEMETIDQISWRKRYRVYQISHSSNRSGEGSSPVCIIDDSLEDIENILCTNATQNWGIEHFKLKKKTNLLWSTDINIFLKTFKVKLSICLL